MQDAAYGFPRISQGVEKLDPDTSMGYIDRSRDPKSTFLGPIWGSKARTAEFFNTLTTPYSITYVVRGLPFR
jgi:hypothetical protein